MNPSLLRCRMTEVALVHKIHDLLSMQNLSNPIHLHRAYSASIAAVGEDKLIVHDSLYPFPKQAA